MPSVEDRKRELIARKLAAAGLNRTAGDDSPAGYREGADLRRRDPPGARYVEIPDAGHYGYLERPDEVNEVLLDFLAVP